MKKKIYPTSIKKYKGARIKQSKNGKFKVLISKHTRCDGLYATTNRSNFSSHTKALRFVRKYYVTNRLRSKIKNMIHDRGSHCECVLTQGKVMSFDHANINDVQKYVLHANKVPGRDLWYAFTKGEDKRTINFSNIVMNHDPTLTNISVDHISRIGIDNRRSNLRLATQREQNLNQKVRSNNICGLNGVHLNNSSKYPNWEATWVIESGKQCTKSFLCSKYGAEEAKQMAIAYRLKMVNGMSHYKNLASRVVAI